MISIKDNITPQIALSLKIDRAAQLFLHEDPLNEHEFISYALADRIKTLFQSGDGLGLLKLGFFKCEETLSPSLQFWQQFAKCFIAQAHKPMHLNDSNALRFELPTSTIKATIAQAPLIVGSQYLHMGTVRTLWDRLTVALQEELHASSYDLKTYLALNTVKPRSAKDQMSLYLTENKNNTHHPFSLQACFIALAPNTQIKSSIETSLKKEAKKYLQLSDSQRTTLLAPIKQATQHNLFLQKLLNLEAIFQGIDWTLKETLQFLEAVPTLETAGITVHLPKWSQAPMPQIQLVLGDKPPSSLNLDSILDFNIEVTLANGLSFTLQEFEQLLSTPDPLVSIKGQWLKINPKQFIKTLQQSKLAKQYLNKQTLSWQTSLQLLAGFPSKGKQALRDTNLSDLKVVTGAWLKTILQQLQSPIKLDKESEQFILREHVKTKLRPYQLQGAQWLLFLYRLKLGGCLADDMGLGKTLQLLSALILIKHQKLKDTDPTPGPHLLIMPASLLNNWQTEIEKFVPNLKIYIAHYSTEALNKQTSHKRSEKIPDLSQIDLVITTYTTATQLPWLSQMHWDLLILDEAQAIKNPKAKQTRIIKLLKSQVRFALTGTPIENCLTDLWSLFDFMAPRLLGSLTEFKRYNKNFAEQNDAALDKHAFNSTLRRLTTPYILRRLKSDQSILQDLPPKTELQTWCMLSKLQAQLYQQTVNQLAKALKGPILGIKRQGLILSCLTRLKQICNHPDQYFKADAYEIHHSGKFLKLQEICSAIAANQEKLLVFTQFREIISPLHRFLNTIFGTQGLYLHGKVPIAERAKSIKRFQDPSGPPFLILSLKAGGTGFNLTAASQVIHFDRWWNPSVEQQATDRAYRIGQPKSLLVHKFTCQGTIEEKIDSLIYKKQLLVNQIIGEQKEKILTQLSNEELIEVITLDMRRAIDA